MTDRLVSARALVAFAGVVTLALAAACGSSSGEDVGDGPAGPASGPDPVAPGAPSAPTPGPSPSPDGPPPTGPTPPSPTISECGAQRVVHLVGGVGGLAWFTQLWPAPAVITGYQSTYAFDDPSKAASVGTATHPLYVRRTAASAPLWSGTGAHPYPTAFVAGNNLTHAAAPVTTVLGATDVIAAGAAAQKSLAPAVSVLAFLRGTTPLAYGPAPSAPLETHVADVDAAIVALKAKTTISAALEAELRPDPTKVAAWTGAGAPAVVTTLATNLAFVANALRHGLFGTVLVPAMNDDPHGAWAQPGAATARAEQLTRVLDGFYAELAKSTEKSCTVAGKPVSLADNTVLVVSGDTPKSSFNNGGWADGTPGGSNFLYVRANGWLVPGWFGQVTPAGKTEFDPTTGALAPAGTAATSQRAALQGLLYAIARGNMAVVAAVDGQPFGGIVSKP